MHLEAVWPPPAAQAKVKQGGAMGFYAWFVDTDRVTWTKDPDCQPTIGPFDAREVTALEEAGHQNFQFEWSQKIGADENPWQPLVTTPQPNYYFTPPGVPPGGQNSLRWRVTCRAHDQDQETLRQDPDSGYTQWDLVVTRDPVITKMYLKVWYVGQQEPTDDYPHSSPFYHTLRWWLHAELSDPDILKDVEWTLARPGADAVHLHGESVTTADIPVDLVHGMMTVECKATWRKEQAGEGQPITFTDTKTKILVAAFKKGFDDESDVKDDPPARGVSPNPEDPQHPIDWGDAGPADPPNWADARPGHWKEIILTDGQGNPLA